MIGKVFFAYILDDLGVAKRVSMYVTDTCHSLCNAVCFIVCVCVVQHLVVMYTRAAGVIFRLKSVCYVILQPTCVPVEVSDSGRSCSRAVLTHTQAHKAK